MADVVTPVTLENETVPDSPSSGADLEKQHSLEKSTTTTSHHHDSEYDTASDLEGGEEDYDDENEESADYEDKDDDLEEGSGSETESEYDDEGEERQRGDGQEQIDNVKKVDEDRSNPQYIPKKGTFYEHDDRTADAPELVDITKPGAEGNGETTVKSTTPTISSASKTMKKWQPASVVDRWSHDRFDENEQAPKSRSELVSAYGYDIRSEDGPPRARRRRRYGRGPSKYNRNWEDESAYIKNNANRRPPRAEEFPALDEKKSRKNSRRYRDEKENRFDNKTAEGRVSKRDNFGRVEKNRTNGKSYRSGIAGGSNNMNRRTIEFKNKNRTTDDNNQFDSNRHSDVNNLRNQPSQGNQVNRNFDEHISKQQVETRQQVSQQQSSNNIQGNDRFKNGYSENAINYNSQNHNNNSTGPNQYLSRDIKEQKINANHITNQTQTPSQILPQSVQSKQSNVQNNQLQARLQQVQNRNDPSHVGSVQMHSLASQQQPLHQANSSSSNSINQSIMPSDLNQQPESGRPKRYSSLRQRSQNEQNVIQQMVSPTPTGLPNATPHQQIDQHSLQQIHLQHDHVAVAAAAAHQQQALLQANLIQLYQDNLQAQQVGVPSIPNINQTKPPTSTNVPPTTQFPAIVHSSPFTSQPTTASPAAYYAPGPNEYAVGPPNVPGTAPQPPYAIPYGPQTQPPPNVQQAPPPPTAQPNALPNNPTTPFPNYPPPGPTSQYPSAVPPPQQFNTVGGTTYFVPHAQPTQRQSSLPQRRPTNAIPILPPSDKNKTNNNSQQAGNGGSVEKDSNSSAPPVGSVENIDHILDNMFVQRQPFQPAIQQSSSQTSIVSNASTTASTSSSQGNNTQKTSENRIDEAIKNLTINDVEVTTNSNDKPSDNSISEIKADIPSSLPSEGTSVDARDPK